MRHWFLSELRALPALPPPPPELRKLVRRICKGRGPEDFDRTMAEVMRGGSYNPRVVAREVANELGAFVSERST